MHLERLLQLRVLCLGFLQYRHIRICILPDRKKVLISGSRLLLIALNCIRPRQSQPRKSIQRTGWIDTAMIDALLTTLEQADLDATVRVVAVRGAGRDFCAGMDLQELLASADHTLEQNRQAALHFAQVFQGMRRLPKPIVALVQGRALAGGCGLATACDLILATESAQFGYPELQRGFVPAIVMTMLRRVVGEKIAFDLAATGRLLDGTEAAALGLASRVYEDADFEEQAAEVLRVLAEASPSALACGVTRKPSGTIVPGRMLGMPATSGASPTPLRRLSGPGLSSGWLAPLTTPTPMAAP